MILRLCCCCFLFLGGFVNVTNSQEAKVATSPVWRVQQIIGHRGASAVAPENTQASTHAAIAAGATAIEVDVRLSKDGRLVLRHDEALERTTNGTGSVKDKTLAELRELDAGSWFDPKFGGQRIPTLAEALALCKGKCDVLLDLKETGEDYARLVTREVKAHGEETRVIVGVRSVEHAKQFRTLLPQSKQLGLMAKPDEIEAYAAAGVETIRLWPKWLSDESLVPRVRKAGVKLHLNGTTGELAEVTELLKHRPDSLSSDDPAKLIATLAEMARGELKPRLPTTSGELKIDGLQEAVEIKRDTWGVAHIYAKNADDLFFAQGFVAAQDRLFQIDLWRRQGNGELAEIMGPSAFEADVFARQVKYRGDMEAEWKAYSPDTKAIATAFTRGINACIEQMGDNLPLEFQLLGYKPKRWQPKDILSRSSGIYMSQNFRNEVQRLKLIDLVGIEKARWLAPIDPPRDYKVQLTAEDVKHFPEKLLAGYEALTKTLSFTPSTSESNNWVVAASRSLSGKPLLASDPHRAIALPSLRYIVHLHAPGWNVIGAGEPGLPGVALGHNERIAWGFTIIGADTTDIYVEELNPATPNEYAAGAGFERFQTYDEEIIVKGEATPRKVTIKHSRHGPIIYEDLQRNRAYALKWIGSEPGGAAYLPALRLARAQNRTEFLNGLSYWSVPGLNFVYADMDGNTGWIAATKYPMRSEKHSGLLPVPGNGGYEWTGYLPIGQYPQELNPAAGHLVTANHNILPKNYEHSIGHEFSPPYRFQRLNELLGGKDKWNLAEFGPLQQDSTSVAARELVKLLSPGRVDEKQEPAAKLLRDWSGGLSVDSPAGSLYALWQRELQTMLFKTQVPDEHMKIMQSLAGTQAANAAVASADPRWFGDNATRERDDLVNESFAAAVQKWQALPAEQQKRWGALHQVTFRHSAAGLGPAAAKLFNIGPFERPGDVNTPNNTRSDDNFQQIHGASYRQLFDLADWDRGLATSAPGQSGQWGSPHYNDLAPLWAKGEYFPLAYSRAKVDEVTKQTLLLKPNR
jgi:penicillin amidase